MGLIMKALYFDGEELLLVNDYPKPEISKGEVLLRGILAGICDTDLQIISNYMNFRGILGHEFVAEVVECENPTLIGKRVVGEINCGCGKCDMCLKGLQNHCPNRTVLGILNRNGVMAEFFTLPIENLIEVPANLKSEIAVFCEPLAAALEIPNQIQISPVDKVLVLGDGKLGALITQVLQLQGCNLFLLGRHPSKLASIKKVCPEVETMVELQPSLHRSFDIVVEATGNPEGITLAFEAIKPRGKIVLKSTIANPRNINLNQIVIDEIILIGSRCGPFQAALRLLSSSVIKTDFLVEEISSLSHGIEAFKKAKKKGANKVLLRIPA